MDETITRFGGRLIELAERTIEERGGRKIARDGKMFYQIEIEPAANVAPLSDPDAQFKQLRTSLSAGIEDAIIKGPDPRQQASAAAVGPVPVRSP